MATANADQIFKEFREHSVAEFFKKNRQMLGYSGVGRSLVTIIHEYTTNGLDACEEAGILPDISVAVKKVENGSGNRYNVKVTDNGPGIPKNFVGRALATIFAGTKFHRYMQQRGQQGVGAAGCLLFSQVTTGKQIFVKSSIGEGKAYSCYIGINTSTNKPVIDGMQDIGEEFQGLCVEGEFADVRYELGEHGVYEYLRRTALSNPHAQIRFTDPDGKEWTFVRAVDKMPDRPKPAKPHPLGLSANDLLEFAHRSESRKVSSFLIDTFARTTQNKVAELREVDSAIDTDKNPRQLSWDDAERLVAAFKRVKWIAPDATSIVPIGESQIRVALKNILDPEHMSVTQRPPRVFRGGVPFIVEAAVAYGGNSGKKEEDGYSGTILRFANRVPLLFDSGSCAISVAVRGIDWKRYGIDMETQPVSVLVNVSSVYIPYSGVGKEAIAQEDEIIDEIKLAVMEAARGVQRYVRGKAQASFNTSRYRAIARYVKQLSSDNGDLTGADKKKVEAKLDGIVVKHFPKTGKDGEGADGEPQDDGGPK